MFKKSIFVVLSYVLLHISSVAEVKKTTIGVELGKDELGNNSSLLKVDMVLEDSKYLFFGLGNNITLSANDTIENDISYVGLSKKFSPDLKVTGMLELSGSKGAFTIFSGSTALRYNQDSYFLELVPALRRVTLTTLSNREVSLSSSALGFKTGLYIGEHLRLSASAYRYNYSRNVALLASFKSSLFFNNKTLSLSSGLLSRSFNAEAGLDYDSFSISVGKNRTISALDMSASDYVYTVLDYYFTDAWGMSLLFGQYLDAAADQDSYSSFALNYSF